MNEKIAIFLQEERFRYLGKLSQHLHQQELRPGIFQKPIYSRQFELKFTKYLITESFTLSSKHSFLKCFSFNVLLFPRLEKLFADFFNARKFSQAPQCIKQYLKKIVRTDYFCFMIQWKYLRPKKMFWIYHRTCINRCLQLEYFVQSHHLSLSQLRCVHPYNKLNSGIGMVLLEVSAKFSYSIQKLTKTIPTEISKEKRTTHCIIAGCLSEPSNIGSNTLSL